MDLLELQNQKKMNNTLYSYIQNIQSFQMHLLEEIITQNKQIQELKDEVQLLSSKKRKLNDDEFLVANTLVSNLNILVSTPTKDDVKLSETDDVKLSETDDDVYPNDPNTKELLLLKLERSKRTSAIWNPNISKYVGIIKINNKWMIKSIIYTEKTQYDTMYDAEKKYQDFILKNNIPLESIIRRGWKQ